MIPVLRARFPGRRELQPRGGKRRVTEVRWKTVASHVLLAKKRPRAPDWKPRLPGSSCPALLPRSGVASLGPLPRTVLGTGGWPPQAPYEAPEGRSVALLRTRAHPHVTPFPLSQNGYVVQVRGSTYLYVRTCTYVRGSTYLGVFPRFREDFLEGSYVFPE